MVQICFRIAEYVILFTHHIFYCVLVFDSTVLLHSIVFIVHIVAVHSAVKPPHRKGALHLCAKKDVLHNHRALDGAKEDSLHLCRRGHAFLKLGREDVLHHCRREDILKLYRKEDVLNPSRKEGVHHLPGREDALHLSGKKKNTLQEDGHMLSLQACLPKTWEGGCPPTPREERYPQARWKGGHPPFQRKGGRPPPP